MLQATRESWRVLIEGPASVGMGVVDSCSSVGDVGGDVDGVEVVEVVVELDEEAVDVVGVGIVRSGSRGWAGVMSDNGNSGERIRQRKVNG